MAARPPQLSGAEIAETLSDLSRAPLLDLLAAFLESAPSPERLQEWANQHPDQFVNAMEELALLAGFSDRRRSEIAGQPQ